MIVITGATGQLGSLVVEQVLARVPAEQVGVSVRDPDRARALQQRGVRVRRGNFADTVTLAHSFEGASRVLIVSTDVHGNAAVRLHRAAIDAARAAGAERVLYTSHQAASPTSLFAPMPDHAATEQTLQDSGVPFTSLRNGFYASSALWLLGDAVKTGKLVAPQDGPVSWTAHADLAEAAAVALTTDDLDGVTPALTASESVDLADLAALASELSGRPIERVVVSDDEHRATLIAKGLPAPVVEISLGLFAASRRGEFAAVDPTLETLIRRPPTPLRDVLQSALARAA